MPDHGCIHLSNKRDAECLCSSKGRNNALFVVVGMGRMKKCGHGNGLNGRWVCGPFRSNQQVHVCECSAGNMRTIAGLSLVSPQLAGSELSLH